MKKFLLLTIIVAAVFSGCSYQRVAVKKGYDFTAIKRIAVVGFSNNLDFKNTGDVVADGFVLELMRKGYNVVERSKINTLLGEQQLANSNKLDPATVKKMGKILGVDAILTGSVSKFNEDRSTVVYYTDKDGNQTSQTHLQQAEVSLSARMFDVETGEVVWTGSDHDTGFELSDAVYSVVFGLVSTIK